MLCCATGMLLAAPTLLHRQGFIPECKGDSACVCPVQWAFWGLQMPCSGALLDTALILLYLPSRIRALIFIPALST